MGEKTLLEFLDPVSVFQCWSPISCAPIYRVEDDSRAFVFYQRHEAMMFARELTNPICD